jgi:hypothetical protein
LVVRVRVRLHADSRLRPQGRGEEGTGGGRGREGKNESVRADALCPHGRTVSTRTDCVHTDVGLRPRGHAHVRADPSVLSPGNFITDATVR